MMNKAHSLTAATLVSLATLGTLISTNTSVQANTTSQSAPTNATRTLQPNSKSDDSIAAIKAKAADAKKKMDAANKTIKTLQGYIDEINKIKATTTPEQLQQTQANFDEASKQLDVLTAKQAAAQKAVDLAKTPQERTNAQNELNTATKNKNDFFGNEYEHAYAQYKSIRVSPSRLGNLQVGLNYAKNELKEAQAAYDAAEQKLAPAKSAPISKASETSTSESAVSADHSQKKLTAERTTTDSQPVIHQQPVATATNSTTDTSKKSVTPSNSHVLPQTGEESNHPATLWGGFLGLFLGIFAFAIKFRQRHLS